MKYETKLKLRTECESIYNRLGEMDTLLGNPEFDRLVQRLNEIEHVAYLS